MYNLELTNQFKKDIKLAKKRGLDMKKLDEVVTVLVFRRQSPTTIQTTQTFRAIFWAVGCHIKSDWLLIWEQKEEIRLISLIRTGSHSDLF